MDGLVAGLPGTAAFQLFLYGALRAAHLPPPPLWTYGAVAAILLQGAISIAWAAAFSYLARTRANVAAHPYLSGVVYGAVVMVLMQIVYVFANLVHGWRAPGLAAELIANSIFFGLPVSLWVSRRIDR